MSTPTERTAADLIDVVTAVPGVRGIEPGITSTLRTIDARIRKLQTRRARYGLVLDSEARTVTVELGLDDSRPIREIVADTQRAVQTALDLSDARPMTVLVRVQSLTGKESRQPTVNR